MTMEAISVIKMMPETALQINEFIAKCTNSIEQGHENPLDIYIKIKAAQKALDGIKDKIQSEAFEEAEKYGNKFERNKASISLRQSPRYSYENVNDPEYDSLSDNFKDAKKAKELKEKELKAMSKPIDRIDQETGEIYTVYPPSVKSSDTIVVSFPEPKTKEFDPNSNKKVLPF